MNTPSHSRQYGLTLLELLVAMAVFAVIGATAYSGLDSVLATRAALADNSERLRRIQLGMEWLRRDLEQLAPRPVRDSFGSVRPALEGDTLGPVLLSFTRSGYDNSLAGERAGLQRLRYRLAGDRLLRHADPVLDGADLARAPAATLFDNVAEIRIRFLDGQGRWQQRWPVPPAESDTAQLPRAIEIQLELNDWGRLRRVFLMVDNFG